MNWPVFLSAASGAIVGVAVMCAVFWWVFYGGDDET